MLRRSNRRALRRNVPTNLVKNDHRHAKCAGRRDPEGPPYSNMIRAVPLLAINILRAS